MEFLYLSPDFPSNYSQFILHLDKAGVNVWGVGEADFSSMPEHLRAALKWYVQTELNDFSKVEAAVEGLLATKASLGTPARFDAVESHNEQWLRLEGQINERFGIEGIRPKDLDRIKKKSAMKARFKAGGLPVARGERIADLRHGLQLAETLGYPLILKPDEGVGAGGIHKVMDETHLRRLLPERVGTYVMEEFIDAGIVTYDGLVDGSGRLLFENSLVYGDGVLEYVSGKDTFFYVTRKIPEKLSRIGKALIQSFGVRRKFFHFEFFNLGADFMPIEINCRPPGGAILDMMNYSVDDDLYAAYARMIAIGTAEVAALKKYYCCYIGRRDRNYVKTHENVLAEYGHCLMDYAENPPLFQEAMGKYRYILRSGSEAEIRDMANDILETIEGADEILS